MCVIWGGWSAKELGIALRCKCHEPSLGYMLKDCVDAHRALQWTMECGQKYPDVYIVCAYGLAHEVPKNKGGMSFLKGESELQVLPVGRVTHAVAGVIRCGAL